MSGGASNSGINTYAHGQRMRAADCIRHLPGRGAYRHDSIGLGDMDFAALAVSIATASPRCRPTLALISDTPDDDIVRSRYALAGMGV